MHHLHHPDHSSALHVAHAPAKVLARTTSLLVAMCIGAVALTGCDKSEEQAPAVEKEELPTIRIEGLPAAPDFDEARAPETWEDGSLSIYGLRKDIDAAVKEGDEGKEVMVKGYVQDIYVAPECPKNELCPPPKQPHVWISDKPDEKGKKRAMMVVNYRYSIPDFEAKKWKGEPDVILEKGKRYTFKGKFKRFSDTGFADDRGLLEFVAYRPLDPATGQEMDAWVYPPGSPSHPSEVARQEQANAKLAEKARKTAVPQRP